MAMISQAFITGVFVTQNITTNIVALFVTVPIVDIHYKFKGAPETFSGIRKGH